MGRSLALPTRFHGGCRIRGHLLVRTEPGFPPVWERNHLLPKPFHGCPQPCFFDGKRSHRLRGVFRSWLQASPRGGERTGAVYSPVGAEVLSVPADDKGARLHPRQWAPSWGRCWAPWLPLSCLAGGLGTGGSQGQKPQSSGAPVRGCVSQAAPRSPHASSEALLLYGWGCWGWDHQCD